MVDHRISNISTVLPNKTTPTINHNLFSIKKIIISKVPQKSHIRLKVDAVKDFYIENSSYCPLSLLSVAILIP